MAAALSRPVPPLPRPVHLAGRRRVPRPLPAVTGHLFDAQGSQLRTIRGLLGGHSKEDRGPVPRAPLPPRGMPFKRVGGQRLPRDPRQHRRVRRPIIEPSSTCPATSTSTIARRSSFSSTSMTSPFTPATSAATCRKFLALLWRSMGRRCGSRGAPSAKSRAPRSAPAVDWIRSASPP